MNRIILTYNFQAARFWQLNWDNQFTSLWETLPQMNHWEWLKVHVFVFFSKMSSECSFDIHKLLAIGSCEIYFIVSFYLTVQVIFLAKTNFFEALFLQCFLMLSGIFKNILLFFKSWNLLMILQLRFNYCGFS